jgi:hypothetical protein
VLIQTKSVAAYCQWRGSSRLVDQNENNPLFLVNQHWFRV